MKYLDLQTWISQDKPINSYIHCDCMDLMQELPEDWHGKILAICDPPYGIGEDGRNNHTRCSKLAQARDYRNRVQYDNNPPDKKYFNKLRAISKNQILWGANHYISRNLYDSSCWLVWDKDNGKNDFADCELAWTSITPSQAISYLTLIQVQQVHLLLATKSIILL